MHRKISAGVDEGLSGASSVAEPGARTPISASGNLIIGIIRALSDHDPPLRVLDGSEVF